MNKFLLGISAAALFVAGSANATLMVGVDDISNGANSETIGGFTGDFAGVDNVSNDSDINLDAIASLFVLDTGTLSITAGTYTNSPANLHLTATLLGVENATFAITATDITLLNDWSFNIGGSFTGDVTATAYIDYSNTAFGTAGADEIGTLTKIGNSGAFSFSSGGQPVTGTTPYALSIFVTVNGSGGVDTEVVPEPSILALFGLGLLGLVGLSRRKQGMKA